MENKKSFLARIENQLSPSDMNRVRGAYYLAKFGHRSQVRKETDEDGNPLRYFEHLRRVALILMDEAKCFDADLICTALLHDSLEDTQDIDAAIIEQFFGSNVSKYVKMLTKSDNDNYIVRLTYAPWQVLLVKACDRLDNLRSLKECSREFQKKQLTETVQKYIPIFSNRCKKINKIKIHKYTYDLIDELVFKLEDLK